MNPANRLPVNRLRGMSDLSQEAWLKKQDIQNRLLELGGSQGFIQWQPANVQFHPLAGPPHLLGRP